MYYLVTSYSTVIALHERLYKKGWIRYRISTLNKEWLQNYKKPKLDKIRLLNVARVNPEKGIFEFLEMFKKLELDAEISIIGKIKNSTLQNKFQSIIGKNQTYYFLDIFQIENY